MDDGQLALRTLCPTCGSAPGLPCLGPDGRLRAPHKDRVGVALQQGPLRPPRAPRA